jgi:hypothetical protein
MDTGAVLGFRYLLGSRVLSLISAQTVKTSCFSCSPVTICSPVVGGGSHCNSCSVTCSLQVVLPGFGENGMSLEIPEGEAVVIDMEYDFIIGLDAI